MSTAKPARRESTSETAAMSMFGVYVGALAFCLIGNLAVRVAERGDWLPREARVAVAVLAALPLILAAAMFWRMMKRDLDEMVQRIVLEGLAFAFVVYLPLAGLYVNLKTVGFLAPRLDPPDLLWLPALLVAIGVAVAWRRFR